MQKNYFQRNFLILGAYFQTIASISTNAEKKSKKVFFSRFSLFSRLLLTFKPLFIYIKTCCLWIHHFILNFLEFSPSDLNLNHQFSWSSKRSKCLSRYQKTKKKMKKIGFFFNFLQFSGQLLPFNSQPDLLSHLRDHSAIFAGFRNDFDTLRMSLKLLWGP